MNSGAGSLRASGPQSGAGRRKSRCNARVHGLTATLPDGAAEAALMQQFADQWTRQLGSDTDLEAAIIGSSAIAYARYERCRKAEEASLRDCSREALERWTQKKRHAIRRKAQDLQTDPYNTVNDLEETSFGCEWLMRHWLKLDATLSQGLLWEDQDVSMAMRLLGYQPKPPGLDADDALRRFWRLCRVVSGNPTDPPSRPSENPIPARSELRRLIAAEFHRLDSLRNELWEGKERAEAEAVAAAGLVDTTKDGQLRKRYARESHSEMIRGISLLMRLRLERSKDDDRRWSQAHPHLPRRRSGFDRPLPADSSPHCLQNRAPVEPPAPPPPADSRNEPSETTPGRPEDRFNPSSDQEMRRESSGDTPADAERTEPRFSGSTPATEPSPNPDSTPATGVRQPSDELPRV